MENIVHIDKNHHMVMNIKAKLKFKVMIEKLVFKVKLILVAKQQDHVRLDGLKRLAKQQDHVHLDGHKSVVLVLVEPAMALAELVMELAMVLAELVMVLVELVMELVELVMELAMALVELVMVPEETAKLLLITFLDRTLVD